LSKIHGPNAERLDQAIARIQSMADAKVHLADVADAHRMTL
jgi:hypothetical protein